MNLILNPKTSLHRKKLNYVLEFLAITFGLLYTVLYIQEVKYCFVFAVLGAFLYAYLCYIKQIFAEVFLQIFYVFTAFYGWVNWGEYGENSISAFAHTIVLIGTIVAFLVVGYFLKQSLQPKLPYLDSFTTVFSITGTLLMVNFIHATWLYLLAINVVSIFLYYQRGMKMSIILYAFYVYLSLAGWFGWDLFI